MAGVEKKAACRELLKKINILHLGIKLLLSLSVLSFIVDNIEVSDEVLHVQYKYDPAT